MAWYDIFKDAASAAQKAGNIDLFQSLLSAQQQAFEIQTENHELKKRIEELVDAKYLEQRIINFPLKPYIMLKDDVSRVIYCATCWDNSRKTIRMVQTASYEDEETSIPMLEIRCNVCKSSFDLHEQELTNLSTE